MEVSVKKITYNSRQYKASVELREVVLRKPLGLVFSEGDLKPDKEEIIMGAFTVDNHLVGSVQMHFLDRKTAKLRQMAVERTSRGKGVGGLLLNECERILLRNTVSKIVLHARKTAVSFYKKQGYVVEGKEFVEVGIPHLKMYKILV